MRAYELHLAIRHWIWRNAVSNLLVRYHVNVDFHFG